jgi:hypothetical protein
VARSGQRCGPVANYLSRVEEALYNKKAMVAWWVVCHAEALLFLSLGIVSIPGGKNAVNQSVLPGSQDNCRRDRLRVRRQMQMEAGMVGFILL